MTLSEKHPPRSKSSLSANGEGVHDQLSLMNQIAAELNAAPELAQNTLGAMLLNLQALYDLNPEDHAHTTYIDAIWQSAQELNGLLTNQIRAMNAIVAMTRVFRDQRDEFARLYADLQNAIEYKNYNHPLIQELIDSIRRQIQHEANAKAEESVFAQFASHASLVIPGMDYQTALNFINAIIADDEITMSESSWDAFMQWLEASIRLTDGF